MKKLLFLLATITNLCLYTTNKSKPTDRWTYFQDQSTGRVTMKCITQKQEPITYGYNYHLNGYTFYPSSTTKPIYCKSIDTNKDFALRTITGLAIAGLSAKLLEIGKRRSQEENTISKLVGTIMIPVGLFFAGVTIEYFISLLSSDNLYNILVSQNTLCPEKTLSENYQAILLSQKTEKE